MITNPATAEFPYPTIAVTGQRIIELTNELIAVRLRYGLGAKIDPIDLEASQLVANGIGAVDCSGFTRWAIWHASAGKVILEDGSVQQHEQILRVGLKQSTFDDAGNSDGVIRIAFLAPKDSGDNIGHVLLLPGDGDTAESFGHHGPGRRRWGSLPFMAKMQVYVLALP